MPDDGAIEKRPPELSPSVVERRISADYRWVRRVIHEIEDELAASGVAIEDIGSISIVLAEALNNIVEHAFDEAGSEDITLVLRIRNNSLLVELRDKGKPMPRGRAPMGNHPMSDFHQFENLPEGGYGWYLIRELVQDLIYDRKNDENILFFRYRLGGEDRIGAE